MLVAVFIYKLHNDRISMYILNIIIKNIFRIKAHVNWPSPESILKFHIQSSRTAQMFLFTKVLKKFFESFLLYIFFIININLQDVWYHKIQNSNSIQFVNFFNIIPV